MAKNELQTPKAEQDIDAWVAEYALGHHVIREKKGTLKERTRLGHIRPLRRYSKDIAAAWEVAEKMGITMVPIDDGSWFALVGKNGTGWTSPAELIQCIQTGDFAQSGAAVTKSPSLSICLAALRSIEKRDGLAFESIVADPSAPVSELH